MFSVLKIFPNKLTANPLYNKYTNEDSESRIYAYSKDGRSIHPGIGASFHRSRLFKHIGIEPEQRSFRLFPFVNKVQVMNAARTFDITGDFLP